MDPPVDVTADAILARLRAQGGRITSVRRSVIGILLKSPRGHLRADEVAAEVRSTHPDVAESTIYRTLSALEDLEVIEHVHLAHGPSTYHVVLQPHQHLVCDRCGSLTEVPDEHLTELRRSLADRHGFALSNQHFSLQGLCKHCRTAEDDDKDALSESAS